MIVLFLITSQNKLICWTMNFWQSNRSIAIAAEIDDKQNLQENLNYI